MDHALRSEIDDAVAEALLVFEKRPDKNLLLVQEDLMAGRRPRLCPLALGRGATASEIAHSRPAGNGGPEPPERTLLTALRSIPRPLDLENPCAPVLGTCCGTATVASAFGAQLDFGNPLNPGGVKAYRPLDAFDDLEPPDPATAGVFPFIRERIECYRALTPPPFRIAFPDLQGPLNNAHLLLGTDLFLAMRTDRARLHRLLGLITDFMLRCFRVLRQWIGPERMVPFIRDHSCIRECSVNLISREDYREFGLPYDRQIAEYLGEVAIHPCSGLHVFEETLAALPQVRFHEWGTVAAAFAPCVTLERALELVGDRPLILRGLQDLTGPDPGATIRDHFARLADHAPMMFTYSVAGWPRAEDPRLLSLRRELDEYYAARYAG